MSGQDAKNSTASASLHGQPERTPKADAAAASPPDHAARIAALFEAHNQALLRFLTCRLHSAQEAREVAQEAYVRLLQLDTPSGISYLRAFLFKTAANLAADRLKSVARRERIDSFDFLAGEEYEPSPEGGICAEQELAVVLHLLDALPARCLYAFVMHRFYGHSIPEVAGLMNLSVRMVQVYVERALVFCRDRLKESSGG